jgi:hypothetical protein
MDKNPFLHTRDCRSGGAAPNLLFLSLYTTYKLERTNVTRNKRFAKTKTLPKKGSVLAIPKTNVEI